LDVSLVGKGIANNLPSGGFHLLYAVLIYVGDVSGLDVFGFDFLI